jgi:thioredoxin reductase (NADPH)
MTKPVILTVDDEQEVLNAISRDLRRHFGEGYRILKALSAEEGLEVLRELKKRGTPTALFLVDQRMPGRSGMEFLQEAGKLHPQAKKTLLTAYADTAVAIDSINRIGLDYYFMKPWSPPERELYPVLEDLLADWTATVRLPYEGIRVIGTLWSAHSHEVKDFLTRNQVPYQWLDLEKDEEARSLLSSLDEGRRLPVVVFPDGAHMVDPGRPELAEKIGLSIRASRPFYDLAIIGGGPAGLGAAVYGASEGLRTVLVERQATGGQAGTSAFIENYLGFPKGLSGADLARRATAQARRFGAEILSEEIVGLSVEDSYRHLRLSGGGELSCQALVIATGVSVRKLEVPGVERLTGAGIYYGAAATEAAHYRGQDVLVVGGANSAGQACMFFSRFARTVHLAVRGPSLEEGMSQYLVDQVQASENIEVLLNTQVVEARGADRLESVLLARGHSGPRQPLPVAAMFIFIGATAHTEMLDGIVERDPAGFILTGQDLLAGRRRPPGWKLDRDPFHLETSVPGIFAAGDVRHQSVKRVASAVGEGAVAVALVHQYLKTV